MNSPENKTTGFPSTFWTANTIELFERGAYYAMASFVVIYLKEALGSIVGAPMGGRLFETFISNPVAKGRPANPSAIWLIVAGMGVLSIAGLALYDRFLMHRKQG